MTMGGRGRSEGRAAAGVEDLVPRPIGTKERRKRLMDGSAGEWPGMRRTWDPGEGVSSVTESLNL